MATSLLKRALGLTTEDLSITVNYGRVQELGDAFYLPITIDGLSIPDISVTNCSGTTGQAVLTTLTAGGFDKLRVGDVVKTFSGTGDVGSSTSTIADTMVPQGLNYIVYPHTLNSGTLPCKAGDAVSGTGIASGATIDKIDYASRTIFLTANNTASGSVTVTITKPARIIEVRKSTEATNPNQVTLDRNLVGAASTETVVFGAGISEAVFAVLKINPLDNTSSSRLSLALGINYPSGLEVKGTNSGLGAVAYNTLGYTGLEGLSVDVDSFLTDARIPRTV